MKRIFWVCLALATVAAAQLAAGTQIKAKLSTEIESANAQAGDQVSATSTESIKQGKLSLPKGTVFNGHVTAVTHAPGSHSPGSVAVLFTQAITPKGVSVPLLAGVASVKLPAASSSSPFNSRGRNRRGGYGGGGYGGGGYGGAPATSAPPVRNVPPDIRFPQDAATSGSVLSKTEGDVWINPQTQVELQIIANPAGAQRYNSTRYK